MPAPVLRLAGLLSIIGLCAALAAPALIAQNQPPLRDNRLFKSGIEITSITATVTDRDGHLITGLGREAFDVYEDGTLQTITQFTHETGVTFMNTS